MEIPEKVSGGVGAQGVTGKCEGDGPSGASKRKAGTGDGIEGASQSRRVSDRNETLTGQDTSGSRCGRKAAWTSPLCPHRGEDAGQTGESAARLRSPREGSSGAKAAPPRGEHRGAHVAGAAPAGCSLSGTQGRCWARQGEPGG